MRKWKSNLFFKTRYSNNIKVRIRNEEKFYLRIKIHSNNTQSCLIFYSLNNGRLDFSLNNYLRILFLSIFHAPSPNSFSRILFNIFFNSCYPRLVFCYLTLFSFILLAFNSINLLLIYERSHPFNVSRVNSERHSRRGE